MLVCRFLLEALEDLDCSLKKLSSRLFVVKGQPTDVFPRLLKVCVVGPAMLAWWLHPCGSTRVACGVSSRLSVKA